SIARWLILPLAKACRLHHRFRCSRCRRAPASIILITAHRLRARWRRPVRGPARPTVEPITDDGPVLPRGPLPAAVAGDSCTAACRPVWTGNQLLLPPKLFESRAGMTNLRDALL